MFSIKKGMNIARVVGGISDGTILKILTKEEMETKGILPADGKFDALEIYGNGQMVKLHEGSFQVLPHKKKMERNYVAGKSGSGKSYWTAKWVKEWLNMDPNRKVKLFSRKPKDEAFDKIAQLTRISLDDDLLDNMIEPKDLKDTLVIFDDISTIRDKDIRTEVENIRSDILETGRSDCIPVISTNHLLYDKAKTNMLLNESTSLTVFPRQVSAPKLRYFLTNYGDLNPKQVKFLKTVPSRWLSVYTDYPMYVIHDKGCYMTESNFADGIEPSNEEEEKSDSD
jgi:hypothetical protein